MANTLWAYGCSWTNWDELRQKSKDFKFWPDIIAETINIDVVNRGEGGTSNNNSFIQLINDLSKIKKDDIIIFEFTFSNRYELNYLIENNLHNNWDSNLAKDFNNGIVAKFDAHRIDYFLDEKFYNHKKVTTYLDFITEFKEELILKDFFTTINLFDYIENTIGAKVKYWFLSIYELNHTSTKKEKLNKTVWSNDRIITFPNNSKNIDVNEYIKNKKLRFFDNNTTKLKWLDGDYHPNQFGHHEIAKEILLSLSNKITLYDK